MTTFNAAFIEQVQAQTQLQFELVRTSPIQQVFKVKSPILGEYFQLFLRLSVTTSHSVKTAVFFDNEDHEGKPTIFLFYHHGFVFPSESTNEEMVELLSRKLNDWVAELNLNRVKAGTINAERVIKPDTALVAEWLGKNDCFTSAA